MFCPSTNTLISPDDKGKRAKNNFEKNASKQPKKPQKNTCFLQKN